MAHTKKMLTEDWIAVRDNPIQRDTERHALKAVHLRTPHPTHSVVHAAEMPGGQLIKLDGHTRALLWKRKEIPAPMQVTVIVYPVKDKTEAEQLYKDFDSKEALETMADKVSGAYNKHNFNPKSSLLQRGNIVQALRMAYGVLIGGTVKTGAAGGPGHQRTPSEGKDRRTDKQITVAAADVYTMINEFTYELHTLDAYGLRQGQITAAVIGAFLISSRKYGHKVTPFWTAVFTGQGSKSGGQMDGIQAVNELMLSVKGANNAKLQVAATASRILNALEKWLKDEWFYSLPRPIDTTGYLTGHEQATERLIKRDDKHKTGARSS